MNSVLDIEKNTVVDGAISFCETQGLEIVFTYEISREK